MDTTRYRPMSVVRLRYLWIRAIPCKKAALRRLFCIHERKAHSAAAARCGDRLHRPVQLGLDKVPGNGQLSGEIGNNAPFTVVHDCIV